MPFLKEMRISFGTFLFLANLLPFPKIPKAKVILASFRARFSFPDLIFFLNLASSMTPPPREPTNDNGLDLAEEIVEDESGVLEVKVESRPEHNTPENAPGPSHSVHREERRRSANDLSCRCKEKCNTLSLACQCLSKSHSLSPIHCGSPKDNAGTVCGQKVKKTASSACANFYKLAGGKIWQKITIFQF